MVSSVTYAQYCYLFLPFALHESCNRRILFVHAYQTNINQAYICLPVLHRQCNDCRINVSYAHTGKLIPYCNDIMLYLILTIYIENIEIIYFLLIWGRCNLKRPRRTVIFLPVYKISSLKITLPKTLQLNILDVLQQMITMNENTQWQIIKDSVLFALSWRFSVSLFHFYLEKKID